MAANHTTDPPTVNGTHNDSPESNTTSSNVSTATASPIKLLAEKKGTNASTTDDGLIQLSKEVEEGNVEYKLKLVDPTPERLEHLTSQLKWRLAEGQGEALYELGVEDNGFPKGLSEEELSKSIMTLEKMAKNLAAEASVVCKRPGKEGEIAEVLIREARADQYIDIRVAVCGNVDAGKSTFIGVLTKGQLDNGRGLARVNVFNHRHEVECGRTSSVSQQILGFSASGECVNYNTEIHNLTWGDIIERSYKVISFIDLAGHEKYLKTTVGGMTGNMPDYCFLMVGANMGVTRMTKEHLGLALALKIPVVIVVTKVDMCPENVLKQTLSDIQAILRMRGVRKMSMMVKTDSDVMQAVKSVQQDRVVPIFLVSNVTGENLDMIRKFLNVVPPRIEWAQLRDKSPEVLIDQTYFVTGVGTVVGGTVMAGRIGANSTMLLGPDGNGAFVPVQIKSVHSKRVPVKQVTAGMSAGFALKKIKRSTLRKGMVLVAPDSKPEPSIYFEADVIILYHSTTIHTNYQPVIQCLTIRQSAKIIHINDKDVMRTGDRARVIFKFLYRPEYLKEGMRVIFREGRCKGLGVITRVAVPEDEVNKLLESRTSETTTSTLKALPSRSNDANGSAAPAAVIPALKASAD